eukprot:5322038-Lingulodinium_polyedra.AAC.1
MESTIVRIVKRRVGSMADSIMSLHWIVQGCPQWEHNGHYCWLDIESALDCTIVSTMANAEEAPVVHCRHRCTSHCRLTVDSTIETTPT